MSESPCEEKRVVVLFGKHIEVDLSNQSYKVLEQIEEAKVEVNNKSTVLSWPTPYNFKSEDTPQKAKKRKLKDSGKKAKKRSNKSSNEPNSEGTSGSADGSWICENCTLINKSSERTRFIAIYLIVYSKL